MSQWRWIQVFFRLDSEMGLSFRVEVQLAWNHKMVWVGRNLSRSSSPTPQLLWDITRKSEPKRSRPMNQTSNGRCLSKVIQK